MIRIVVLIAMALTLAACSPPNELELHIDSIHLGIMDVVGVPDDVTPDDGGLGYGDANRRSDEACGARGTKSVNFIQRSPEFPGNGSAIIEFEGPSPKQQAETIAQHLIGNGWDIQRYVSNSGGHNIIANRQSQEDHDYLRFATSDQGGYNAFVQTVLNCTKINEGVQRSDWTPVETFPPS